MADDDVGDKVITAAQAVEAGDIPDFTVDDDDFIQGVVVVVITQDGRGTPGFYMRHTRGLSWLVRLGAFTHMAAVETQDNVDRILGFQRGDE